MSILRAGAWNGAVVVTRLGAALVLNKVLAVLIGPSGFAIVGQFQNLMSMITTFASGAMQSGLVKFTAEYGDDHESQARLWSTATRVLLLLSVCTGVLVAAFAPVLDRMLFNVSGHTVAFVTLAAAVAFINLNGLLQAVLTGRKEIRRYGISNIAAVLTSLALVTGLTWRLGTTGALIGLGLAPALTLLFTLQQVRSAAWFSRRAFTGSFDPLQLQRLGGFMAMGLTTALVTPASQLLIRAHLVSDYGIEFAGVWDALTKVSLLYLTFFTTMLSLYYVPRISEAKSWAELRAEILKVSRFLLPLLLLSSATIYALRDMVVELLFTAEFRDVSALIGWQLAGDVAKCCSWIVAYLMIGRGLVKLYIVTEVVFAAAAWLGTVALTDRLGFPGVSIAYFVTYSAYGAVLYLAILSTASRRAALFSKEEV